MRNILFLLFVVCGVSCSNEPEDATIQYHFIVKNPGVYQSVDFSFLYTRAHTGENVIRTVYLPSKDMSFRLDEQFAYFIGSSIIEPEEIVGYDLLLGNFTIMESNQLRSLKTPVTFREYAKADIIPEPGKVLNLYFELDLASSVVLDSAGTDWILPRISISHQ